MCNHKPPARRENLLVDCQGQNSLARVVAQPVNCGRQMRTEFLAKFYFACRQSPQLADHLLVQQLAACEAWLADLRQTAIAPQPEIFTYAVQQFRISQVEAFLAWLITCRQALPTAANRSADLT